MEGRSLRSGRADSSAVTAVPFPSHAGASSRVAPAISAGHSVLDHFAAVVEVQILFAAAPRAARAPRIDAQALLKPENSQTVQDICESTPRVPWSASS